MSVVVDGVQTTEYVSIANGVTQNARYLDIGVLLGGTCYGLVGTYRPDVDANPPSVEVLDGVLLSFQPG